MQLEIEQKFPLADASPLIGKLHAMEAFGLGIEYQADTYYSHPCRDFAATDEALRIRRTSEGARLTYKGPKLDPTFKTRHEIDLPLGLIDTTSEDWPDLLLALGFREVATVSKQRERYHLERAPYHVEVCIDEVEQVGLFAEVEIVADDSHRQAAQQTLTQLASDLQLTHPERRSYLEMLLG